MEKNKNNFVDTSSEVENSTHIKKTFNVKNVKLKGNSNFCKAVIFPLFFGMLGSAIVITSCSKIPAIRNILVKDNNSFSTQTSALDNSSQVSLVDYSNTSVGVAQKVLPSIVGIEIQYTVNSFFYGTSAAKAEGSGIIISKDGYILTNSHVVNTSSSSSYYNIEEASKVIVHLYNDETEYEAKIVGTDAQTDLAVIKIEKNNLVAAELGDSDTVKVGEFSMAIGNPLGLQSSVTCGVISAINRNIEGSNGTNYTVIQTDAAINSGNSGGALVNNQGQVIGINTLKVSGSGIEGMGFAIPINSTIEIYKELIDHNKVIRPYIGVSGIDINEQTAKKNNLVIGVYIQSIEDFSAAQKAGLKIGDVITAIDGKTVSTMDEITSIKNSHKIGDTIKLSVYRDSKTIDIDLTLTEAP